MSTIKVQNVQHPSAASAAIALASDGTATLNGLAYGALSGRNRIINGDMRVAQRGTSFTANGYTLDRWGVYNSGGSFTLTQETAASGSQPEAGMGKYLRVARTSPSGIFYLYQRIEDVSLYDGFSVTVSFYAKAGSSITLPVRLSQDFGSGGSTAVAVGTINTNVTTSWAKYTASFTLPSLSGKTIGTSSFLELNFDIPATTATVDITGVQLEAGTVATPFERRSYGQELALCQRYCNLIDLGSNNSISHFTARTGGSIATVAPANVFYPTMRAAPSTSTGSLVVRTTTNGSGGTPTTQTSYIITITDTRVAIGCTGLAVNTTYYVDIGGNILLSSEL